MRLESICFGTSPLYRKMARVLEYTALLNSPDTPLLMRYIENPDKEIVSLRGRMMQTYIDNVRKTKHHCQIVQEAKDGEIIGLLDSDMMITNPIELENTKFDLAYTIRPSRSLLPFNTGVIFVKISDKTKLWYRLWYDNAMTLLKTPKLFQHYRVKYGRINQSALGMLIEERPGMIRLQTLPCFEWNCIPESWNNFTYHKTKIVHLMGELRWAINNGRKPRKPEVLCLFELWKEYEYATRPINSA